MTATTNQQPFFQRIPMRRSMVFGILIMVALISFEIFNYSTTDFALGDLLGGLRFLGIRWATILAIAFCGIEVESTPGFGTTVFLYLPIGAASA